MSVTGLRSITYGRARGPIPVEEVITSLAFATDHGESHELKGIILNEQLYGESGTRRGDGLVFEANEFITTLTVNLDSTRKMLGMSLDTNLGRSLKSCEATDCPSGNAETTGDVRLLSMGAYVSDDGVLAGIQTKLIKGGANFTTHQVGEEALAVIDIIPQFSKFTVFESSQLQRLDAASSLMERQFSRELTTTLKVTGEASYGIASAKFEASVGFSSNSKSTDKNSINQELQSTEFQSTNETIKIPGGYIGLELVKVKLMKESYDGFEWLYPVSSPEFITVSIEDGLNGKAFYDLTGILRTVLPGVSADRLVPDTTFPFYSARVDAVVPIGPPVIAPPVGSPTVGAPAAGSDLTPVTVILAAMCGALFVVLLFAQKIRGNKPAAPVVENNPRASSGSTNPSLGEPARTANPLFPMTRPARPSTAAKEEKKRAVVEAKEKKKAAEVDKLQSQLQVTHLMDPAERLTGQLQAFFAKADPSRLATVDQVVKRTMASPGGMAKLHSKLMDKYGTSIKMDL